MINHFREGQEENSVPAENLLVVDDDQAFLDLMAHHLRRKGNTVECALDGKEALHILQSKGPFTVLVTDLMMPGMSGLELLRLARKVDPTIGSPPMLMHVLCPMPAWVNMLAISVVMPPLRDITPTGPGV